MWLVTTSIAALIVTLLFLLLRNKYKLGFLSLMLWGAAIMILVDHILGYKGGKLIEMETDGVINNGVLLGLTMLAPVFLIWIVVISISRFQRK
jgi:hypothetical protein